MRFLRSKANIFLRLAGLGLFIWAVTRVDLPETLAILRQADPWLVVLGISMAIPSHILRSWRLKRILGAFGMNIRLPHALLIRLVGLAAGDLFPGRAGEVISVAYLQKAGFGLREPALALILDRLFDFVILAAWALAGLSVIGRQIGEQARSLQVILVLSAVVFSLAIALLLFVRFQPGITGRLARRLMPARWQGLWDRSETHAGAGSGSLNPWNVILLAQMAGISMISFAFLLLRGFMLARSIGIDLSFAFLTSSIAITALLQIVPASNVMGVGTREVSLVYLFGLAGVSGELAIGFSFLILLALLAQDSLGLLLWWKFPVGIALAVDRETLPLNRDA